MKISKTAIVIITFTLTLIGSAHAEESTKQSANESAMKGFKLGFGYDRGFGITGSYGDFMGFIGNDGIAVDYIFYRQNLKVDVSAPMNWYIGGGGYIDWEDDFGARAPVGAEIKFAKNVDAYAQAIPRVRINDKIKFGLGLGIGVRYIFD